VAYSTLLKGFARQPDKVMELYTEMRASGIQCNTITYNTILNAFAQCGAMDRVPELLEDMRTADPPVESDIVTFSTLVKGFCAVGDLDQALELVKGMKQDAKYAPDEVMYNSLLGGCAKEHRVDEALHLMDDMRASGVAPSNYTLSMLVKLLGRSRNLSKAFAVVESVTKEYGFHLNIQVYTCLIQACFQNRQPTRASLLLDQLLGEGLRPDEKTYSALVRGCVQAGQVEKAAQMARRAYQAGSCVDARCLEEVAERLGSSSDAATELLAEVETSRLQSTKGRGVAPSCVVGGIGGSTPSPWRRNRT